MLTKILVFHMISNKCSQTNICSILPNSYVVRIFDLGVLLCLRFPSSCGFIWQGFYRFRLQLLRASPTECFIFLVKIKDVGAILKELQFVSPPKRLRLGRSPTERGIFVGSSYVFVAKVITWATIPTDSLAPLLLSWTAPPPRVLHCSDGIRTTE